MIKSQNVLTEVESKEWLKRAGIPVVEAKLARSRREAIAIGRKIGFPLVLKINSPDVVHKTDSGGVVLGVANATRVGHAYTEILSAIRQRYPTARIQGVSVQPMAPAGVEVIVGMSKDPQFGPVLMFGLGGILVEVLKDVSFRIVPVTERDASDMIREIKGYPILEGYRGQRPASISALVQLVVKVSRFVEQNPQIEELDLNPVFAYPDRAVATDARIIVE